MADGPNRTVSFDMADALEQAVSAVHDDDLLLVGGGANELTIDQIHSLSSKAGRPWRNGCRPVE